LLLLVILLLLDSPSSRSRIPNADRLNAETARFTPARERDKVVP
jgi:hypothetical protein